MNPCQRVMTCKAMASTLVPRMDSTLIIFSAMLAVAAMIAAGAMARWTNWLTQEADTSLLNLTVRLLLPCLILDTIVGNDRLLNAGNVIVPPLAGFTLAVGGMFLAWGLAKLIGPHVGLKTSAAQRTFAFSVGIVNYGFIPIPLTDVLWRDQPAIRDATMGVLLVHNTGVDLAIWTIGIIVLTGSVGSQWWKRVVNPVSVTIIFAILLNATGWHALAPDLLRSSISKAIHLLGAASVPLSLVLVGASVVDHLPSLKLRSAIRVITFGSLIRQGILPVIFIGIAWLLPVSPELSRVLVIQAAMPSAMVPIILARHYEGDPATALRVAMGTTFIALIATPLWLKGGLTWVGLGI